MIANLPFALDLVQVAVESGENYTTQIVQAFAGAFGTMASWKLLAELQDAGVVAVLPNRRVAFTVMGKDLHRNIEQVIATVQDVEGKS